MRDPAPLPTSSSTYEACTSHVRVDHSEQGWCLLCNGVILFDDGGAILPDGRALPARAA